MRSKPLDELSTATRECSQGTLALRWGCQRMGRCSSLKFYRGTGVLRLESRTASIPDQAAPDSKLPEASSFAVSPGKPDFSGPFISKEEIEFWCSMTLGMRWRQFGLEFTIDGGFESLLRNEFGNDLPGEERRRLDATSPAVFVSSSARRIDALLCRGGL
jgi:hypothetical protein